jgi:hypothetical protein
MFPVSGYYLNWSFILDGNQTKISLAIDEWIEKM